jgi:AcrR family transcriptional regulator
MTAAYAARVKKPALSTRERILDAALELFIERGVAGTTVTDIERAVGLAAGTGSFYRHFRSKEDLVVPAFERGVVRLQQELDDERTGAMKATDDAHERRVVDYHLRIEETRRFHPLWIFLLSERAQFPQLKEVFANALGMRSWDFGWDVDPARVVALAALVGYQELGLLEQQGPFRDIPAEDFIAFLVELTARDEVAPRSRRKR